MNGLDPEVLKRQMIFRLVVVFLIVVVFGFIVQDVQTAMEFSDIQTVTDLRR